MFFPSTCPPSPCITNSNIITADAAIMYEHLDFARVAFGLRLFIQDTNIKTCNGKSIALLCDDLWICNYHCSGCHMRFLSCRERKSPGFNLVTDAEVTCRRLYEPLTYQCFQSVLPGFYFLCLVYFFQSSCFISLCVLCSARMIEFWDMSDICCALSFGFDPVCPRFSSCMFHNLKWP